MSTGAFPSRLGDVRQSQLVYTYGPGSLIDLPHLSILVSGTDSWSSDPLASPEVVERRLLGVVKRRFPTVSALRLPPHLPETPNPFDDWARTGIAVSVFPTWVRCPACRQLSRAEPPLFELKTYPFRPELAAYHHANCRKAAKAPAAVPARFVLACRAGHLDEFPWVGYVHRGSACNRPPSFLEMFEPDQSGGADDVFIKCNSCGATRSMVDAFGEAAARALPRCRGRHPHIRRFSGIEAPCEERTRTLLLGASNMWFSVTLRALAVPDSPTPLAQLVENCWPQLSGVPSLETLAYALANVPGLGDLSGFGPAEVWDAVEKRRESPQSAWDEGEEVDLLVPEWEQLSRPGAGFDYPDFKTRELPAPHRFQGLVQRVVAVERLREVVALAGFTRVDPPGEADSTGDEADVGPLCLGRPTWVPCTEVRGEGLFIQFHEKALEKWAQRVGKSRRLDALLKGHQRWRARRGLDPTRRWPGKRYLALHSFAHLLMRELSLECGYGPASIRERIYARAGAQPMAGVLLYTAAPDSEGTLGGLVSLAEPGTLGRLIGQALNRGRLCASDPMCAEHVPTPDEEPVLHGAACHTCLFAPETSCESANRYLDRTFVVETLTREGLGLIG